MSNFMIQIESESYNCDYERYFFFGNIKNQGRNKRHGENYAH